MEWLQFEHEIRDLVEAFGYHAEATTPSYDFGVDVIAHNNNHKVVVQCKLYGKGSVGGDTMMKLVGSRHYFEATDAICITTSKFTRQAQEIAAEQDIKLIDRKKLILLCQKGGLTIPSLTVLSLPSGDTYNLSSNDIRIGRNFDNDIVLDSPYASKYHAVLHRHKLALTLKDCGSTNGTKVNEARVVRPAPLNYGDNITICETLFIVALQTPDGKVEY